MTLIKFEPRKPAVEGAPDVRGAACPRCGERAVCGVEAHAPGCPKETKPCLGCGKKIPAWAKFCDVCLDLLA